MSSVLIKVANIFDRMGQFDSADKIDSFLKNAAEYSQEQGQVDKQTLQILLESKQHLEAALKVLQANNMHFAMEVENVLNKLNQNIMNLQNKIKRLNEVRAPTNPTNTATV